MKDNQVNIAKLKGIAQKAINVARETEGETQKRAIAMAKDALKKAQDASGAQVGPPESRKGGAPKPSLVAAVMKEGQIPDNRTGEPVNVMTDEEVEQQELALGEENRTGAMRTFAQGLTLGWGDEIEALIRPGRYEDNLEEIQFAQRQHKEKMGGEAIAQEVAGGIMLPGPKTTTVKGAAKVGAGIGAVYGAGTASGDLENRIWGAVKGGTAGALVSAPLQGMVNKAGNFKLSALTKRTQKVPTVENLKAVKDEAYKAVDFKKNLLDASDVSQVQSEARKIVNDMNYLPEKSTPTVIDRALKMIDSKDVRNVGEYEALRKGLSVMSKDPTYGGALKGMIAKLDEVADAKFAVGDDALKLAREANRNYSKARMVDDAIKEVNQAAKTANTKPNTFSTYRNAVNKILKDPNKSKFLSAEDKAMMEQFVNSSVGMRIMGRLGQLAPSSSNFWAVLHTAGAASTGNPLMLLTIAATELPKVGANRAIVGKANKLIESLGGIKQVNKAIELGVGQKAGALISMDLVMDELFPPTEDK
jgi:hypothetical protein